MKIAVAGTGYVGLVAGVCFSEVGHNVVCVDVNEKKIEMLKKGISPIYEQNLEEMMMRNYSAGRLDYTTDYASAYKGCDVIFIGVGTPEREDGSANLKYVFQSAKQIAEAITKNCIVVVKSTVPIGTNDEIEKYIKDNLKENVVVDVVSNPEFLAQGTAVKDTLYASRIIIGTENERAKQVMLEVYKDFKCPILCTNRRSAEMIKYASNDFLALKISYMNDIANLCEMVGADVVDVAKGMSYDNRIGDKFLNAGCGYGGSCFPKDTKALHFLAGQSGYELKTVKAAIEVNRAQKVVLIKKARQVFPSFEGLKVAVLGLTFKPGTDDLREAPSIDNIKILLAEGAIINAYDPVGIPNCKRIFPQEINYVDSPIKALCDADCCFIFTEWDEIKKLTVDDFFTHMKNPVVFDGRNIYSKDEMKKIKYYSIGR